jgi:hypothetical protein
MVVPKNPCVDSRYGLPATSRLVRRNDHRTTWESRVQSLSVLRIRPLPLCAFEQVAFNLSVRIGREANGQPRVTIGAPLPVDGRATNVRTGIRINDPNGAERFALYLLENGRMGMGFDAPPGKGDDRNRERINIVADEDGGAYIRFLDRRTSVPARIYLDDQNQVWVEFSDFTQNPTVRRRIGLKCEETVRSPR